MFDIEIGGWFVKHVHVGVLNADRANSETLQLSTRQQVDITVEKMAKFKDVKYLVDVIQTSTEVDEMLDGLLGATNGFWNLVDVLRLDNGL